MSNDILQETVVLPQGYTKWARKYFALAVEDEVAYDLEALFNNEYTRIRESLRKQLENAEKLPEFDSEYAGELARVDKNEDISGLQKLVANIREATKEKRKEIATRMEKLHSEVLFEKLDLKQDPNVVRENVNGMLKGWDLVAAEKAVNLFEAQVKRAKSTNLSEGRSVKERHEQNKIAECELLTNTHQAKVIATRLIGPDGKLILDSDKSNMLKDMPYYTADDLPFLLDEIRAGKHPELPQNEHALAMLHKIKNDKSLQEELERVAKPPEQDSVAAQLIRDVLGLEPGTKVTDVHARQAALSGLLTQTRQGAVGSCFATALVCKVQREQPKKFISEINQLFATGKHVHRTKDGSGAWVTIEIPLNKECVKGNLEKKTDVKRKDSTLHLAPDMVASMDSLGIPADEQKLALEAAAREIRAERALDDALSKTRFPDSLLYPPNTREAVRAAVLKALKDDPSLSIKKALQNEFVTRNLSMTMGYNPKAGGIKKRDALAKCAEFDDENQSDSIKPEELIEKMCKAKIAPDKQAQALKASRDAFLGQQDNLMLRAYEYTIATATDRVPGKFSNKAFLSDGASKASKKVLDDYVDSLLLNVAPKNALKNYNVRLQAAFNTLIQEKLESRYNPSVKKRTQATASDGHSSSGGFALYYKEKEITSSTEFKAAMSELIAEATTSIWSVLTAYQKSKSDELNTRLLNSLDRDSFHEQIVDILVAENGGTKDDLVKPWARAVGGNSENISQIYGDHESEIQRINSPSTVDDAEKLGNFLLDTLKSMKVDKKVGPETKKEEATVTVATKGIHAFNLLPGSDGVMAMLQGFDDPKVGLQRFKADEQAKTLSRNATELALTDPPSGAVKKIIQGAIAYFPDGQQQSVIDNINLHLKNSGKDKITPSELDALIAGRVNYYHGIYWPLDTLAEKNKWLEKSKNDAAMSVASGIVPKEEFGRLIDVCFKRLDVPQNQQKKIREDLLKSLKDTKGMDRDEFTKKIEEKLTEEKMTPESGKVASALKIPPGVVICDFNWGGGDDRKLGTLIVNPRSGAIEMWQVNQDGSGLTQMDNDKWIKDTDWQVYSNPDQWGGIIGDPAWEKKRGEQREKLEKCLVEGVGDINAMQSALEIADTRFADSKFDQATKALETLEALTKNALKLLANREQAVKELDEFVNEITKANTSRTKEAVEQVSSLKEAVKFVGKPEDVDVLVTRHSKLCELLKAGKASLGIAVDVDSILKQTA